MRKTNDTDERKEYVNLIIDEVERLGKIVEDLINFAKPKEFHYDLIDVNKVIEDSLILHSENLLQKGIAVRKRLSKLPLIMADRDKLKQIVVNILLNSMDAVPDGGELIISSGVIISEDEGKEVATFQFKDTGQGISDDVLAHVFEPFYTTKPEGVGLGLAVCKSIIEQHGGSISIQTEKQGNVSGGTLITFTIPINSNNKIMVK